MDYQVDNSGDWFSIGSFSDAENSWSGTGPDAELGTHTLQVRNHDVQANVSNTITYTCKQAVAQVQFLK
jgi:hypothetical protein